MARPSFSQTRVGVWVSGSLWVSNVVGFLSVRVCALLANSIALHAMYVFSLT